MTDVASFDRTDVVDDTLWAHAHIVLYELSVARILDGVLRYEQTVGVVGYMTAAAITR